MSITSREFRSEITAAGELRLSIEEREVSSPGPDEVVVRVEAAPVNPSDVAGLLGFADVATLRHDATADPLVTTAELPPRAIPLAARARRSRQVEPQGEPAYRTSRWPT